MATKKKTENATETATGESTGEETENPGLLWWFSGGEDWLMDHADELNPKVSVGLTKDRPGDKEGKTPETIGGKFLGQLALHPIETLPLRAGTTWPQHKDPLWFVFRTRIPGRKGIASVVICECDPIDKPAAAAAPAAEQPVAQGGNDVASVVRAVLDALPQHQAPAPAAPPVDPQKALQEQAQFFFDLQKQARESVPQPQPQKPAGLEELPATIAGVRAVVEVLDGPRQEARAPEKREPGVVAKAFASVIPGWSQTLREAVGSHTIARMSKYLDEDEVEEVEEEFRENAEAADKEGRQIAGLPEPADDDEKGDAT